jgi:hypothetical protein
MHFNTHQFNCRPMSAADTNSNRHLIFDADRHYGKFPFNIHQILGMTHQQDHYQNVSSSSVTGRTTYNCFNPQWMHSTPEVTCSRPQVPSGIMRYISLNTVQKLVSANSTEEQNNEESGGNRISDYLVYTCVILCLVFITCSL